MIVTDTSRNIMRYGGFYAYDHHQCIAREFLANQVQSKSGYICGTIEIGPTPVTVSAIVHQAGTSEKRPFCRSTPHLRCKKIIVSKIANQYARSA